MSYELTYQRYNTLQSDLKIEIKRIDADGNYEANYIDIEKLIANQVTVHNSIPSLGFKLPNESFSYGVLRVPNCTLKLLSINGEFSSQDNSNSIFNGFLRHRSLVKISHGYTDPETNIIDYVEVYRGFINENSRNTRVSNENTYQDLFIEDLLTFLLKDYTFSQFTLSSVTLNELVFELFNRPEFTDFLSVDAGNINAGYDIQNVDFTETEGQTQWLNILQNLSIGHSYLFQKEGVLYYQSINDPAQIPSSGSSFEEYEFQDGSNYEFQDGEDYDFNNTKAIVFGTDKVIKFNGFNDGVNEVFEKIFWKDTALSFVAPTVTYNRSKTFDIETITNNFDRNNILAAVGTRTSKAKRKFKLKIALYVKLTILEVIRVNAGNYVDNDSAIWDLSNWDEVDWGQTTGASETDSNSFWTIKEIKHNFQSGVTDLKLEEV